jgi:hypothetical protein
MASTTFTASGDGQIDIGTGQTVTDMIGIVTTFPATIAPLSGVAPLFVYHLGYFSFGADNNFTGTLITYWQTPIYIPNVQFAWDFAGGNPTQIQYIRWHMEGGAVASCKVFY